MPKFVPGRGPVNAKIVVVGEAPGRQEEAQGLPFVGPSGKLQDAWIRGARLDPSTIRFENVYPYLPPGGHIEAVPWEELVQWKEDLKVRLDDLPAVCVIVPTGNTALSVLLDCPSSQAKITQRRGSIYRWSQVNGRQVKVIPIIHPAAVLREEGERSQEDGQKTKKNYEARCRRDWEKVTREVMTGSEDVPPFRGLIAPPDMPEWDAFVLGSLTTWTGPLAFDIETNPEKGKILCISFARSADRALSVPWSKQYKEGIRALLEGPAEKVTQNGHYDCFWLAREGFRVNNWQWDTMAMSCLLWPNEPHSLAYLASILTREPWYKGTDEDTGEKRWNGLTQVPEGYGVSFDKWHALLEYNARDAAVTWECWAGLKQRLEEKDGQRFDTSRQDSTPTLNARSVHATELVCSDGTLSHQDKPRAQAGGWMQVYWDQYQALFQPILDMMLHGMAVHEEELANAHGTSLTMAQGALARAQGVAQIPLFTFATQVQEACWKVATWAWDADDPDVAKKLKRARGDEARYIAQVEAKGISNQILASVLYGRMRLPTQRQRRTKAITTDEAALLKLRARYKDGGKYAEGMALIEHVLRYREQKKQSEFLDPRRVDSDGRFRASYSFRPTTGRLSSSANPRGTGGNAQNIDRTLRGPFKPDAGCMLLECDLSQAEARVVYCLTGDKQLIELAHMRPSQFDVHTFMAKQVFGLSMEDYKRDRYLAKRIVHATHYDMHGNKCSEVLLKDGYDVSPKACTRLQEQYHTFAPGLRQWQQRTRMEVLRDRALTNAWGRTIEWPWDHFGDDLYRKAYAWKAQSDIARHLNRAWAQLYAWMAEHSYQSKINAQLHDALLLSVYPKEVWPVMQKFVQLCEEVHNYYGVLLTIPVEIKLGTAWGLGDVGEWKELPEKDDVEACVEVYSTEKAKGA